MAIITQIDLNKYYSARTALLTEARNLVQKLKAKSRDVQHYLKQQNERDVEAAMQPIMAFHSFSDSAIVFMRSKLEAARGKLSEGVRNARITHRNYLESFSKIRRELANTKPEANILTVDDISTALELPAQLLRLGNGEECIQFTLTNARAPTILPKNIFPGIRDGVYKLPPVQVMFNLSAKTVTMRIFAETPGERTRTRTRKAEACSSALSRAFTAEVGGPGITYLKAWALSHIQQGNYPRPPAGDPYYYIVGPDRHLVPTEYEVAVPGTGTSIKLQYFHMYKLGSDNATAVRQEQLYVRCWVNGMTTNKEVLLEDAARAALLAGNADFERAACGFDILRHAVGQSTLAV